MVRFICLFFKIILVQPLSNSYHQFAAGGRCIDGPEITEIQSPIFSGTGIDFTFFHEQAFTSLPGEQGSGKSSLFQVIAQVVPYPYSGQVLIGWESQVSQVSIVERKPDG